MNLICNTEEQASEKTGTNWIMTAIADIWYASERRSRYLGQQKDLILTGAKVRGNTRPEAACIPFTPLGEPSSKWSPKL